MNRIRFGVFDHIEHLPGVPLTQLYAERLTQMEALDEAGFFAYHLAEHHTPAVHSMAPSQNVFLAAAAQRTKRLRFGPGVYVLPLHHPLRLIEEVSMLDHLSNGRLEIGVGRGGVLEAFFWGQEGDEATNARRYEEVLGALKAGLANDELTFAGEFFTFDHVPMRLRPLPAADAAVLVHAQPRDRRPERHELHRGRLARHAGGQRDPLSADLGRAQPDR